MAFDLNAQTWQILPFGAEDDNGNSSTDNDGTQDQGANNQQQQNNSQQDDATNTDDDDDDGYEGLSAKELRRIARDNATKAKNAEREANTAKSKLSEEERKKLSADQQKDLQITELNDANAKLRGTLSKQALINGILSDRRFEWHNPEIVAAQLSSTVVTVDDDGKVDGLAKELSRIAKDEQLKFLLAKDNTKKNDQQQNNGNNQQSGLQPGQGGANQGGSMPPNAKELAELIPALRGRM